MDEYRPGVWDEYIGQRKLKDRLALEIAGAKHRDEMVDHILLMGPPGCGKTSIAALIAEQMDLSFNSFIMPIKPNVMRRVAMETEGEVVFFDEIHRMSKKDQEGLLSWLEDGYFQLDNGLRIENECVTIIGATTEKTEVIPPLYDRFTVKPPFDEYKDAEMGLIVKGMAKKVDLDLPIDTCNALGRATGGVPRNAKAFVKMALNLAGAGLDPSAELILKKCRITADGLTEGHLQYLHALNKCGGTAGVEVLGAHLGENKPMLIQLEKLLVKRGMMEYTPKGRTLTGKGYKLIK